MCVCMCVCVRVYVCVCCLLVDALSIYTFYLLSVVSILYLVRQDFEF